MMVLQLKLQIKIDLSCILKGKSYHTCPKKIHKHEIYTIYMYERKGG